MRKLLLLAVLLTLGAGAKAQVTTTDVSGYDYVFYNQDFITIPGAEVSFPLFMKNKQGVRSFQFQISLPSEAVDGSTKVETAGLNNARFATKNGGTVFDCNVQPDGSIMVIGTILHEDGFYVGDDVIGYLSFTVPEDAALGEYAVTYKEAIFDFGGSQVNVTDGITSKLIVSSELVFDENSSYLPGYVSGKDANVTVKRTIKANQWSTIVLPFRASIKALLGALGDENAEFAAFSSFERDDDEDKIQMKFTAYTGTNLVAGRPYLVKTTKDISEFSLETVRMANAVSNVTVEDPDEGYVGMFTGSFVKTIVPADGLFISGNKFYYSKGETNIKGLRGWFELEVTLDDKSVDAGTKIRFSVDDEATSIDGISEITKYADGVYSVTGAKVSEDSLEGLPAGVYIVNGKKVYKK